MSSTDLDGLKFRSDGEKMIEIAVALMRKVDDTVARMDSRQERMENKLEDLSKERMAEAREAGENSAKIKTLQAFKDEHMGDHKWLWRAISGAFITAAAAALFALKR